jgi:hypothetical protein
LRHLLRRWQAVGFAKRLLTRRRLALGPS